MAKLKNYNVVLKQIVLLLTFLAVISCAEKKYYVTRIEGKEIGITNKNGEVAQIENIIKPYREKIDADLNTILSYAPETIDKSGEWQTPMGNFLADITFEKSDKVFHMREKKSIDICLLNHGGIRTIIPKGDVTAPLCALLVDSWYDSYLGVVILVRIIDGELKKASQIKMVATDACYTVDSVGIFTPKKTPVDSLKAGEVGFFTASIKQVVDCKVGDTIIEQTNFNPKILPGFQPNLPVVFCGLYPADSSEFEKLRESLSKLRLNDSSFEYELESSSALGFGFR